MPALKFTLSYVTQFLRTICLDLKKLYSGLKSIPKKSLDVSLLISSDTLLSEIYGRYKFWTLERSENNNVRKFCIRKIKRPKFVYFSIENVHTEYLNLKE